MDKAHPFSKAHTLVLIKNIVSFGVSAWVPPLAEDSPLRKHLGLWMVFVDVHSEHSDQQHGVHVHCI